MYKAIMQVAAIDKNAVMKKAENAKFSHRTPNNCNKILDVLQLGYEVVG